MEKGMLSLRRMDLVGVGRFLTIASLILFVGCLLFITVAIGMAAEISAGMQLLIGAALIIPGVIGGAYVSVIFELIARIAGQFDEIKNDIASKNIKDPKGFAQALTQLLSRDIKYSFFSVGYAYVKIVDEDFEYSDRESITKSIRPTPRYDEIESMAMSGEIGLFEKYSIANKRFYLYIIPIIYGEEWLGYIGLFTVQKLGWPLRLFLDYFENYYVDDALVLVLDAQKQSAQKRFYGQVDLISNKVSKLEYTAIDQYQQDVLECLVKESKCAGGLFATVYSQTSAVYFSEPTPSEAEITGYFREFFARLPDNLIVGIASDANVPGFKHVLEVPIQIDTLKGFICLFNNDDRPFQYYLKTFHEIENIKLDNDLENLARILGLQPLEDAFLRSKAGALDGETSLAEAAKSKA